MTVSALSGLSHLLNLTAMIFSMIFIRTSRFVFPCLKLAAALLLLASATVPAGAVIGEWLGEGNARVRFLAAGVDSDGRIAAGVEIRLKPGWKTYWRSPGDAGIAPLTDFSASSNIGGPVEIEFPVPHRFDDGYSITNVYEEHVVLLVNAPTIDVAAKTSLALAMDIGVCAEICIPEHYEMRLDLAPGESDPRAGAILAEARTTLPGKAVPGVFGVGHIVRTGGADKRPIFEIGIVGPEMTNAEVFVEGPNDWYPSPPKLLSEDGVRATYSVVFSRLGAKTPIGGNKFRVTITSAQGAIEDFISLD